MTESHFFALPDGSELHLRRFPGEGSPLLLLHGAIENGRIFYSQSGKGLAPWLAQRGYDVWVLDLGGRGESRPAIAEGHPYSQTGSICEEIPAAMDYLSEQRPGQAQYWIAHSWGGVLMNAVLARFPERRARVGSAVFFGSKRRVRVWNWQRLLYVDVIWCWLTPLITRIKGYLPARGMGWGSDDESILTHAQSKRWVRETRWVDPADGFDYSAELGQVSLPPTLYIAGQGDRALGHPKDVKRFLAESGQGRKECLLLSRTNGHARDYGHIDMLTAPEAAEDHFHYVAEWLEQHARD